ncbi:MAG: type II toxin-antitoxin system death-on-curing family toxin [Clostridia bacterium]|nr:type II toxin-antitoxin system death-on-curing family toxin [Clostridia bacterium]MBQ6426502.1 type II toxin-antitoxin system death-on-curing family toxin [Clostridia bacterium]MBR0445529.1 type II toxin-antitoxin system death-on-curing family toxin [Clostridia bacterium]
MIRFSKEKVLLLHQLITEETGGDNGVRDFGLLDSALESVYQTFDGAELYPSKEEKGARLGYALISNHAFVDGNKRIGMYVMLAFLQVNGVPIHPTNEEVARVGLAVASGEMDDQDLLAWVRENTERLLRKRKSS